MATTADSRRLIRFGVFEVDPAAGEVRKRGLKIKLQGQPLRVLAALLVRPGELVSREELREKVWPSDTFVEFDQSLNTAINKVREVLGDSADSPRFVETVPRRGYRFIAPVEVIGGHAAQQVLTLPRCAEPAPGVRKIALGVLAGVALLAAAVVMALRLRSPTQDRTSRVVRFAYSPEAPVSDWQAPAVSRDGRHIAYVTAEGRLGIQDLDQEQPREIQGTDDAKLPFWSPSSDFIGFAARSELKKVGIHGGPATAICVLPGVSGAREFFGGAWSPDGDSVVFAVFGEGLFEVAAVGGTPTKIFAHKHVDLPSFLPLPKRVLLYETAVGENHDIVVHSLDTDKRERVATVSPGYGPKATYSPTGHVIYASGQASLWALPFSLDSLRATGDAFPIAEPGERALPSVADDGTLVYLDEGGPRRLQLVWRDRSGNRLAAISPSLEVVAAKFPRLSPGGGEVAVTIEGQKQADIAVVNLAGGLLARLTSDPARDDRPIWSPKGDRVTFSSDAKGTPDIVTKSVDGKTEAEQLVATSARDYPQDWSPDGKYLVFLKEEGTADIWYLRRKDGGSGYESAPFLVTPNSSEHAANLSPDGRFLAYNSNESGDWEVYVRQFPQGGGPWQVSTRGGVQPRWRRDGKELFYVEGETLMAITVTTTPGFSVRARKRLFECRGCFVIRHCHEYDVTADGQRFLVTEPVGEPPKPVIRVVQNWFSEFRDSGKHIN